MAATLPTDDATEFLSAASAALVHDEAPIKGVAAVLSSSLPWVESLPAAERELFATEAADTLRACASIGRFSAFAELIDEWRATGEVWSDPALAASLGDAIAEPLGDPV